MKKITSIGVWLLTACVTINIYFPAAAAEKAADKIIQDIQKNAPPDTHDDSRAKNGLQPRAQGWQNLLETTFNLLVSPAYAEGADLSIDSPQIRQLQSAMQSRFPNLLPYYKQGFIGIQSDGLLALVNAGTVPLKDRNTVNKLLAAENADRISLYKAIADANGHPDWFDDIKATFAQRWIGNAQAGWYYQSGGQWVRK